MTEKKDKYDLIISSASKLFAQADFQSVSMEDVAAAAKVGKGTLYNYFKSKDDLYFSILRNRLEKLLLVLKNAYNGRDDFLQNMKSLVLHLNKFLKNHPYFHKIWNREEHFLKKDNNLAILELKERILNLIGEVLIQGKKEKILEDNLDTSFTAQIVYCLINYVNDDGNPQKLFSILINGIGKKKINIPLKHKSNTNEKKD